MGRLQAELSAFRTTHPEFDQSKLAAGAALINQARSRAPGWASALHEATQLFAHEAIRSKDSQGRVQLLQAVRHDLDHVAKHAAPSPQFRYEVYRNQRQLDPARLRQEAIDALVLGGFELSAEDTLQWALKLSKILVTSAGPSLLTILDMKQVADDFHTALEWRMRQQCLSGLNGLQSELGHFLEDYVIGEDARVFAMEAADTLSQCLQAGKSHYETESEVAETLCGRIIHTPGKKRPAYQHTFAVPIRAYLKKMSTAKEASQAAFSAIIEKATTDEQAANFESMMNYVIHVGGAFAEDRGHPAHSSELQNSIDFMVSRIAKQQAISQQVGTLRLAFSLSKEADDIIRWRLTEYQRQSKFALAAAIDSELDVMLPAWTKQHPESTDTQLQGIRKAAKEQAERLMTDEVFKLTCEFKKTVGHGTGDA